MIRDKVRMEAYTRALKRAIKPGCTVLDLGAGTGIFSLLACQYGAGKVYAIEPNDSLILAKKFARVNGFEDRIEFFQKMSTEVELDQKADVIIADLRGALPFSGRSIESMIDARERMLAPGGQVIPKADTLYVAVYTSAQSYHGIENPWLKNEYALDLSAGLRFVTDNWTAHTGTESKLLTDFQPWGVIDYRIVSQADVRGQVDLVAHSAGTAHGICVWFDAELADGIGFTNAPDAPPTVYGSAQFPWPKPVEMAPGDRVSLQIETRKVGSRYLWRWHSSVFSGRADEKPSTVFSQSTFNAQLISPQTLHRSAENSKPVLTEKGQIQFQVLGMMDGNHSLKEIAQELHRRYPLKFTSVAEALSKVTEITMRFTG